MTKKSLRVGFVLATIAGLAVVGWLGRSGLPRLAHARAAAKELAWTAGDGLGYGNAFAAELLKIGQITPGEFEQRYGGKITYLPKLSWDPTTATFFDRFSLDPNRPGAMVHARGDEAQRIREFAKFSNKPLPEGPVMVSANGGFDFRLNEAEMAAFKQNGFVVSERMGAASCTEMLYRIYKRDLPVLITTDAILHAWHRSYDAILEEVETSMLIPALNNILTAMSGEVAEAKTRYGAGLFQDSVHDADYFLAVARSLLAGYAVESNLGNDDRVARTIEACNRQGLEDFILFGAERKVDFSQFKPRGHYEKSEELQRYFKTMMWCGRIDLRVAGNPKESSARQLASVVVLHDLLQKSGNFERWRQFDQVIQTFVGQPDSMTFAQLGAVLNAAGIRSPADVKDAKALEALAKRIEAGAFGAQEIRGDFFYADPNLPGTLVLPRSFTFLGQRFAVDSWVTGKVVYDDIYWDDEAVIRRIPSGLDVSFAALGNDHTVPLLVSRMNNANGRKFRDGLNYQHNLAATRAVIDAKPAATWGQNLYNGWLGCLRELSRPTGDGAIPEAMQTQAWAMKTLNTQLASWTQLRHDTILYVKQSYTSAALCYYPAGFVEPVPHFWGRLEQMMSRAADLIEATPYPDHNKRVQHSTFLRNFAKTVKTLRVIAEKELAQQELDKEESKFFEDVVEVIHLRGSGGQVRYAGWYHALFYLGAVDSLRWDALVADVHTDVPDPIFGDPGCVLHQGVGCVDLLLLAVDNGKDRMVFAGPVLSHYEFELGGVSRMADSEWKSVLQAGKSPPRPEWTRGYLVPGVNAGLKGYVVEGGDGGFGGDGKGLGGGGGGKGGGGGGKGGGF
jgi:hypothetical protein